LCPCPGLGSGQEKTNPKGGDHETTERQADLCERDGDRGGFHRPRGASYAATQFPKNSVGTKQLKNNAVKGPKVADDSLTAADINGPVDSATTATEAAHAAKADQAANADHATTADQATNAGQLGGAAPSSFFPSSKVKRVDVEADVTTMGTHEFPLLTMGPLTLTMACNKGGNLTIGIGALSSAPGATVYLGFESSVPSASGQIFPMPGGESSVFVRTDAGTGEAGSGQVVYRDANTTITIPFGYFVSNLFGECRISGVALQS
jgi:hypothetical protein